MAEIGIRCTNPDALRERLVVWDGLSLVPRDEADSASAPYDPQPLVLPRGIGRAATMDETLQIVATPGTERVMQLVRLPRRLGELCVAQCKAAPPLAQQFAERTDRSYLHWQQDLIGQVSTTNIVNELSTVPVPIRAGLHIDGWAAANTTLSIINGGPGERLHCIAPGYTPAVIGGSERQDRIDHFSQHPNVDTPVYGIRIDAPTSAYYEALIGVPVAHALHDGSTIHSQEWSQAALIYSNDNDTEFYPSPL